MKRLILSALVFLFIGAHAQVDIIPQPVEVVMPNQAGTFTITAKTPIKLEGSGLENAAAFLNEYLMLVYGFELPLQEDAPASGAIRLSLERMDYPIAGAYQMHVSKDGVYIAGDNKQGVFYGIQTLIQLLPVERKSPLDISYVSIKDYPRFQYRGLHFDVCRHFFPVSFVKRYIDYIALHKLNTLHWHLTDDQGWRIEIKKYPELTRKGAWRDGTIIGRYPGTGNDNIRYGGFYTQEEIKEVVAYAAKRYVQVIPEIEMPGHSSAALTAYPQLGCTGGPYQVQQTWGVFEDVFCAGNDSVFTFLQDVLDEVIPLFPGKYIHIGGDECPKESWKKCAKCQQRIREHGLKDEHELQSYFIQRIEKYINSKGKTIIGWDEILEGGLAPNAVVMSWRGEKGGIDAAKLKHDVIMTPGGFMYFDHTQSKKEDSVTFGGYTPLHRVYSYEPVPAELSAEEAKHILGAQANLWTEYIKNTRKVEYQLFPRLSALSEVVWSPKEKRNWNDFEKRLQVQFKRYDLLGINYSTAYFDLQAKVLPAPNLQGVVWSLSSPLKEGEIYYVAADKSTIVRYQQPLQVTKDTVLHAVLMMNKKERQLVSQRFHISKATGRNIDLITRPSSKYPGDGAFTLVNGIINERGLNSAEEFLGFEGTDLEAVIDLGRTQPITTVTVWALSDPGSWIHGPSAVEILISSDGKRFRPAGKTLLENAGSKRAVTVNIAGQNKHIKTRFVKVNVKNFGTIPQGQPGAGNPAWLFVDEIQVH